MNLVKIKIVGFLGIVAFISVSSGSAQTTSDPCQMVRAKEQELLAAKVSLQEMILSSSKTEIAFKQAIQNADDRSSTAVTVQIINALIGTPVNAFFGVLLIANIREVSNHQVGPEDLVVPSVLLAVSLAMTAGVHFGTSYWVDIKREDAEALRVQFQNQIQLLNRLKEKYSKDLYELRVMKEHAHCTP